MVHFLSSHGPYRTKLFELNIIASPECECGENLTPEHVVLECRINQQNDDGTEKCRIVELRKELQATTTTTEILRDETKREALDRLASAISHLEKMKYIETHRQRRNT